MLGGTLRAARPASKFLYKRRLPADDGYSGLVNPGGKRPTELRHPGP